MTVTSKAVSVQEAAVWLGRSERTVWRQIRSGVLRSQREGHRVLVLLDEPAPRVAEVGAAYEVDRAWIVGSFPYTPAVVGRHDRARLARRRAAAAELRRIAGRARPDPEGLTAADYVRSERDEPRALAERVAGSQGGSGAGSPSRQ